MFTGIPSCTKALIRTARSGGSLGYQDVGRQVGEHLCANVPLDLDTTEEWIDLLDHDVVRVIAALPEDGWNAPRHLAPLRIWLGDHFPGISSQVPARHRLKFTEGFVKGVISSGDWLF